MNSLRNCPTSGNVSFPLRTVITDVNAFYSEIKNNPPVLHATYNTRSTNPKFKDSSRTTGEIDEARQSIKLKYKDNDYNLISVQLTQATHRDWLPKTKAGLQVNNKTDIIITLECEEADPRFFIIVIPMVIDNTITVDNQYLMGLADLTAVYYYSLQSLFIDLKHYLYYTTCLEPHGDNAFVYINTDGLKISQVLYNSLLAIWTNQSLSTLQQKVLDTISPVKDTVKNYLQKITSSSDIQQIKDQLQNLQLATQVQIINPKLDTWPRYTPLYDIILNVPANIITSNNGSKTTEGFANSADIGYAEDGGLSGNAEEQQAQADALRAADTEAAASNNPVEPPVEPIVKSTIPKEWQLPTNNVKCVALDPDTIIDSSGNINFDQQGNMLLSDVQKARDSERASLGFKGIDMNRNTNYFVWVVSACIIILLAGWGLSNIASIASYFTKNAEFLPKGIENIGLYSIVIIICTFAGFLVGAAVNGM